MAGEFSDNIALLRSAFGDGPLYVAEGEAAFDVDGVRFVCDYQPGSTAERFYLVKNPDAVPSFIERAERFAGKVVVELGIAEGGSVALLALSATPRKLLAFEVEQRRVEALDELVRRRGLADTVHLHFGVDQADRSTLRAKAHADLGDEPIDLVIDDASHKLEPTRSSFETLFPLVRPGGLYVIEDWSADLRFRAAVAQSLRDGDAETKARFREAMANRTRGSEAPAQRPLSDLIVELVLLRAQEGDIVRDVDVSRFDVTVRRGEEPVDAASFRIHDHLKDYYGYLS